MSTHFFILNEALQRTVKGAVPLYRIFVNKPILRDNACFVSNETKDQWRTVITQLQSSRQIEIDAIIGSSVSNLSWMNFNTMLLVLMKTNNLIQVK